MLPTSRSASPESSTKIRHRVPSWCIFDNTALGVATVDALTVKSHLLDSQRAIR